MPPRSSASRRPRSPSTTSRVTTTRFSRDPERDPRALADRIDATAADLFDHLEHVPDRGEISWLGLIDLPVASLVAIQIGEFLVHGHDLAAAAERRLRIAPERARLALHGLLPLVPLYVDRRAARGFFAAFDIRVRGGVRFDLVFDDGEARIEEPTARRIDCRISADPVAYLLVSYGRMAPTTPALTGKIVAWGRKPWLGFKLPTLLRRP